MHFWMTSGALMGAAAVVGWGLGHYVVTPQAPVYASDMILASSIGERADADDQVAIASDRGPADIRCTGCGPTLAERRMAADQAGADLDGMIGGSVDPIVRDYLAQGESGHLSVPASYRSEEGHPPASYGADPAVRHRDVPPPAMLLPPSLTAPTPPPVLMEPVARDGAGHASIPQQPLRQADRLADGTGG